MNITDAQIRAYAENYTLAQLKDKLRGVVRHEFRHHMENLAGVYGADSLEHEDREELKEIVYSRNN